MPEHRIKGKDNVIKSETERECPQTAVSHQYEITE